MDEGFDLSMAAHEAVYKRLRVECPRLTHEQVTAVANRFVQEIRIATAEGNEEDAA